MRPLQPVLLTAITLLVPVPAPGGEDTVVAAWQHADDATVTAALALARRAFDAFALRRDVVEPPAGLPALLGQRAGVFVSAMRHGAPRCCMGSLFPTEANIAHELVASAAAAAGRDRRFSPILPGELRGLTLIVSIVGRPQAVSEPAARALDPVRDGLAVRCGDRYGVVLSGETGRIDHMLDWARIRAGARPGAPVEFFRLDVYRMRERGFRCSGV